jgi:hypothetical protein
MSPAKPLACLLAVCCAPIALSGCAGIEVMHQSAYCPDGRERQVVLVRDQAQLEKLWRGLQNSPQASAAPGVDLRQRRVLYLADTERPTGGYGLSLASPTLTVAAGVASLNLETSTPQGMATKVITRPCLLLSLPGGDYTRVEAFDQTGKLWGAAE